MRLTWSLYGFRIWKGEKNALIITSQSLIWTGDGASAMAAQATGPSAAVGR